MRVKYRRQPPWLFACCLFGWAIMFAASILINTVTR